MRKPPSYKTDTETGGGFVGRFEVPAVLRLLPCACPNVRTYASTHRRYGLSVMRGLASRFTARVTDILMFLSEVAIGLMMLHVVTEIFSRRLFRVSLDSVPEIVAFYYMASVIFLSLAYVTRADAHVSATLFTDLLPERAQQILMGFVLMILAGVMVVIAWQTGTEAMRMMRIGEFHQGASMNLPKWPTRWFVPAGAGLMALVSFLMALDKFTGRPLFPGVDADEVPAEQRDIRSSGPASEGEG